MIIAITIASGILLILTALPRWRNPHWLVRSLDFPRLQFTILIALVLLLQLLFMSPVSALFWLLLLSNTGCLLWQLGWILPYTRLWPVQVAAVQEAAVPADVLAIMVANVYTPNRNAEGLLRQVRELQPDVLVTLESDLWWQQQLDQLEQDMPHTMKCPLDNLYGMHVYSRLPLSEQSTEFLIEQDVPSMHATVTMRNGRTVRMHFLHPAPPAPGENEESVERDAELLMIARAAAKESGPVVVTGDLNDVAWSRTTRAFRKISGLLDPRIGRGMYNSFHAAYPFIRWPLDHLFHSKHFKLQSLQRLQGFGSDHFPILVELACNKQGSE